MIYRNDMATITINQRPKNEYVYPYTRYQDCITFWQITSDQESTFGCKLNIIGIITGTPNIEYSANTDLLTYNS